MNFKKIKAEKFVADLKNAPWPDPRKKAMKPCKPDDWKSSKSQKIFVDKEVIKAKREYFRKQIEQSSGPGCSNDG